MYLCTHNLIEKTMTDTVTNIPAQQIPFSKKNKTWRKKHLDWAD